MRQPDGTHSLEDLLHTLATCQQVLDPSIAARHSRRIRWIEDLPYAVVRDDPAAGRSRGGDPAQYPLQILSRIVFDHTTDLISVVAADGCYVYPNPAHLTVLGVPLSPDEPSTLIVEIHAPVFVRSVQQPYPEGIVVDWLRLE